MYQLRPYQTEAIEKTMAAFQTYQSLVLVMATGLGKTVVFSSIAARFSKRVLIIAHVQELVHQAAEKIEKVLGVPPDIEMGELVSADSSSFYQKSKAVIATRQTLSSRQRIKKLDPFDFDVIIIDEAHHITSQQYQSILDYFKQNPNIKILGVTATPKRADKQALGRIFEHVPYQMPIQQAVREGWLVDIKQKAIEDLSVDFSKLRTSSGGDFVQKDLENVLAAEESVHKLVVPMLELVKDRPTLVFCNSVAHAEITASIINRYKPNSAVALFGDNSAKGQMKRKSSVEKFKNNEIQFLCNCQLFTEGFDAPNVSAVVMARPTKSLPLYTQIIGRGTRTLPGVIDSLAFATADQRKEAIRNSAKSEVLVIDFVGNSGRHKLISSVDVLGGDYDEKVIARAKDNAKKHDDDDPEPYQRLSVESELILASLQLEEEELRKAKIKRNQIKASSASYSERDVDPYSRQGAQKIIRPKGAWKNDPATEKQIRLLIKHGYVPWKARSMSKAEACRIIGSIKANEQ